MPTAKIDRTSILAGNPVDFGLLTIYQPSLKDINKIGYDQFARITNLLTISESDLLLLYNKEHIENGETNPILWLYDNCLKNPTFFLELQIGFLTYIKEEVFLDTDNKGFKFLVDGEKVLPGGKVIKTQQFFSLTTKNFSEFQSIVRLLNMSEEEDDEIITDDLEMKRKFEEARKKLKLAKAKARAEQAAKHRGKEITLPDIVSSLCAYGVGYTLFNVWDLTIYQLYDQFKRLQLKENYETGTQMLLAGVDSKKVDLQYWIKKITL